MWYLQDQEKKKIETILLCDSVKSTSICDSFKETVFFPTAKNFFEGFHGYVISFAQKIQNKIHDKNHNKLTYFKIHQK